MKSHIKKFQCSTKHIVKKWLFSFPLKTINQSLNYCDDTTFNTLCFGLEILSLWFVSIFMRRKKIHILFLFVFSQSLLDQTSNHKAQCFNYCDDTNIQSLVLWAKNIFIVVCFNFHEEKKITYIPLVCFFTKFIALDFKPQNIVFQIINPHISKAKKSTMTMKIIHLHSRCFCIHGMLV